MKKIPKSIFVKISPAILYMEDLEEIEEIYKDNFEDYKITVKSKELENDFEFGSVKELTENFNKKNIYKLHDLSFESYNPYINIYFRNIEVKIYSSNNDVKSIGITSKLKNATDKKPFSYKFLTNKILLFISLFFILLLDRLINEIYPLIIIALLFLFLLWGFWLYNIFENNYSTIRLKRRSEQKGFLTENKNNIMLFFISALFYIFREVIASKLI